VLKTYVLISWIHIILFHIFLSSNLLIKNLFNKIKPCSASLSNPAMLTMTICRSLIVGY